MLIILLFVLRICVSAIACPPDETIAPNCECISMFGIILMTCKGLMSPDDLISPMKATVVHGSFVNSLAIENSSLLYIPNSVFKGTRFQKIRFFRSEVMSLSDSSLAFQGLENTLEDLRATEAHYIAQWDWKQLKKLKKLQLIDVNDISMRSIDEPLPELLNLRNLGIINAEISFIIDYAFHSLTNLVILNMKRNDISELKRNMLPMPADNLQLIDFSNNKLTELPEDFFTKMPNLKDVKLERNRFSTLPQKTFTWALRNLDELIMEGNPFRCDCRLHWMTGGRLPYRFIADCETPALLAGTPLRVLQSRLLWC